MYRFFSVSSELYQNSSKTFAESVFSSPGKHMLACLYPACAFFHAIFSSNELVSNLKAVFNEYSTSKIYNMSRKIVYTKFGQISDKNAKLRNA